MLVAVCTQLVGECLCSAGLTGRKPFSNEMKCDQTLAGQSWVVMTHEKANDLIMKPNLVTIPTTPRCGSNDRRIT